MFALGIDFITGVAVMTDAASREKSEWPPHPARIFMAMVAAHYESRPLPEDGSAAEQAWVQERLALEWLEGQDAPEMNWPEASPRDVMKVYVPVNDAEVPANPTRVRSSELRGALGVMPEQRSRQERTFPALYVGGEGPGRHIYLRWPGAQPTAEGLGALDRLARKITRIGHSSSLTVVWVANAEAAAATAYKPNAKSTKVRRGLQLRVPAPGFLAELDQCFNGEDIDAFFEFLEVIAAGKGRAKEEAKAAFQERFGMAWSRNISAPVRLRPSPRRTAHYSRADEPADRVAATGFDSELLVLTKQEGPVLGLESTAALTAALRGYLLNDSRAKPEWFTGHSAPGVPSTRGHMAVLPLAFVGAEHADGHILGLALAFPRTIGAAERAECLRGRLFDPSGVDLELELRMGSLGTWTIRREERSLPPLALRSATWCQPSSVWASVTPIVLDRHPKFDQRTERTQWCDEVAASILQSCERQGLPKPDLIDVDKTSWHRGAPRAKPGPDGMPWLPGKEGVPPRQQVHVLIRFPCEVQGPLLLGAGRFRGYGLCKPLGFPSK
jgi:CRISPR-associated protein Csb2